MIFSSLFKKGFKDSVFYFLGTSATKLISFVIVPFVNIEFSVEEFGRYDLFLITSTFLMWLVSLGFDSGMSVKIIDNKDDKSILSYLFTRTLLISLCLAIPVFFIFFLINKFFVGFFNNDEVFLLFAFVLFAHCNNYVFNLLRWLGKSKRASIVSSISSILGITIGFVFIFFFGYKSIYYLMLGLVLGHLVSSIYSLFIISDYISFKNSRHNNSELKSLIRISLPFIPVYLVNYFMAYSDRFLIMFFLADLKLLGVYAFFYRIAQIFNTLMGFVTKGFSPVIFSSYKSKKGRQFGVKVYHCLILSYLVTFIVVFFVKDFFVEIMGAKNSQIYFEYSYFLPVSILSVLLFSLIHINGFGYRIKNKTIMIFYITFFGLVINFLLTYLLVDFMGYQAIFLSTLISSLFTTFFYTYYSEKLIKFGYNLNLIISCYSLILLMSLLSFYIK